MIETLNASQARELANKNREELDKVDTNKAIEKIESMILSGIIYGLFVFRVDVACYSDVVIKNVMSHFIGRGYGVTKKHCHSIGGSVLEISFSPMASLHSRIIWFLKNMFMKESGK